jgi:archaellum biogenesis ATPase FlaH
VLAPEKLNELQLQTLKLFCLNRRYFTRYQEIAHFEEPLLRVIFEQVKILYQHTAENHIEKDNLAQVLKLVGLDDVYFMVLDDLYSTEINTDAVEAILNKVYNRHLLHQLYTTAGDKLERNDVDSLEEVQELLASEMPDEEADDNISLSLVEYGDVEGLNWPCQKIQARLGPLPPQTLGLIAAMPETGKTAMVVACSLFFRQQGARVLHINNEDPKRKILERYYVNFFERPTHAIYENLGEFSKIFHEAHEGGLIIEDDAQMTPFQLDYQVRRHQPDVVFIDQADHLARDSEAATLEALYYRQRQMAKKRNTRVIAVSQASLTSGPYLVLSDLHNSKIGKQGNLDWMMGLFAPENYPQHRNVSFPKNKLTGDKRTCVLKFNPTLLRYED